jgi:Mrp family chromosome partitioning ATPase
MKSDAVILATLVDEVVLVLRADRSTREEALEAQQDLAAVGARVVGVVLNAVNPRKTRRGYRYGYGYTYAHTEGE